MARALSGSNQWLQRLVAPGGWPLGIACRFSPDLTPPGGNERLVSINDGSASDFVALFHRSGNVIRYSIAVSGVQLNLETTTTPTALAWNTVVSGTNAGGTDHFVCLNGDWLNRATSSSSKSYPTVDRTDIGAQIFNSSQELDGRIAEVVLVSKQPTQGEVEAFAAGVSANIVWPDTRIHHIQLWGEQSPEPDGADGGSWTVTGATQADHPPLIFPGRRAIYPAAAGGTDALTATSIATGAPTVGSPVLGQANALTAVGVATGTPSVGSPVLGQIVATEAKRALGVPMEAASLQEVIRPIVLVRMQFSTDALVNSSDRTIRFDWDEDTVEEEFLGVGRLGEISAVEESAETRPHTISLAISGVDPANISLVLGEQYQGADVRVWLALVDSDYAIVGEPYLIFRGLMDVPDIELGQMARITMTAHSRLVDWDRPRVRRYTNEDQRALYPDDRGLEYVAQMIDREIAWGVPR